MYFVTPSLYSAEGRATPLYLTSVASVASDTRKSREIPALTSTVAPFLAPNRAFPIGDSFDILFSNGSASLVPTIVYSSSSSSPSYLSSQDFILIFSSAISLS